MGEPRMSGHVGAYLEHYPEQGGPAQFVPIERCPFLIGRSRSVNYTVYSQKVSKQHAAITKEDRQFLVLDLGSTNGTFVNGRRVEQASIRDGDILHIAHFEFCFYDGTGEQSSQSLSARMSQMTEHQTMAGDFQEKESLIRGKSFLEELVKDESVSTLFQPIVDLLTGEIIGFEALGRGNHHRLSQSPMKLFELAEKCHMATDLCRLFRIQAIRVSKALPAHLRLFVNVHPAALTRGDLIHSLAELNASHQPCRQIVVEVSEHSVTDVPQMRAIQRNLREMGLEFAYDDFGVGQARLLELTECPPHFLKLDMSLIVGIEDSEARRELVRALIAAGAGKGIQVIAEGIETEQVAQVCRDLGCHHGQGFYFGRPTSPDELRRPAD